MGTATMAKRPGRKRKHAKRTKSGQISRSGTPRDTGTPELARRVMAMKGKGTCALVTDQLCAMGLITDEQNQAAALYRWFRDRGYGKPDPKIGGYGELISEGTLRPIADIDPDNDPQARAERAYMAGRTAVQEACSIQAGIELTRVVIDNERPLSRDFPDLLRALDVLRGLYFGGVANEREVC